MGSVIGRRRFLAATGGLITASALPSVFGGAAAAHQGEKHERSALVLSSDLYASPDPQRFVFALAKGERFASFKAAQVAFAPPGSTEGTVLDTTLYKKGLPTGRGVYVVDATFPVAGVWTALVVTEQRPLGFAVEVKAHPEAPIVGAVAPRAVSPTPADTLNVMPICTRRPKCPLHDTSLDQLTGTGMPLAVMFATPARCQSQYCGPVLDELLDLREHYADRIQFHHVDIYRSNRGTELSPTVEAWGLPSEPWLFTVDATGVIRGRLDGAFGLGEINQELDALVAASS